MSRSRALDNFSDVLSSHLDSKTEYTREDIGIEFVPSIASVQIAATRLDGAKRDPLVKGVRMFSLLKKLCFCQ
jgi:hypothetical protein